MILKVRSLNDYIFDLKKPICISSYIVECIRHDLEADYIIIENPIYTKEPKIEKNEIITDNKEEEDLEIKPEEIQLKPNSLKMDILLSTSSMQHQNGLRAGDYLRYAHFCRKKIQKLRKMNHLSQGKRKFQKVEITPQLIKDNKIFLILILECERNWAYGMYHKQELTFIGEDIKRLRHEITRKFKRATLNAKKIFDICQKIGDTQTQLEGEAYYHFINSNFLIFTSKFQEALDLLKKACNIYEKIKQVKDTIESIEYEEKIKSMKTSMRLCVYNLSSNKDTILDEAEFEKTVNVDDIELTEKIEEIKKGTNKINEEEFSVKYHGVNIPIKNDKLRNDFEKLNELNSKIEKEKDVQKKILLFQDYYNRIDEMNKLVKKIKGEEGNQSSENFSKIYGNILNYIENLRLKKYIDKNLSYISEYSKEYNTIENINNLFEKDNLKLKVKPQEMMKLYDNLKEYQSQLINLEKDNPEQSYIIELNYREKIYTLSKIFYVGLAYVLNKKNHEAYTIMFYTIEKIKEANEFYEQHHLENVSQLKELKSQIENMEKLAIFVINTAFVKMHLNKQENIKDKEKKENKDKKIKYNPYLADLMFNENIILSKEQYENLKDYITLPYEDYLEGIKKHNFDGYTHIMQIPMNTQLLEPKPIVYDLTFEKLEYPDLTEKTKEKSKSLMGRAFGYFFGGGK
jgi:signal recognition particle subunit SRP68